MPERPAGESLVTHSLERPCQHSRRDAWDEALDPQQPAEVEVVARRAGRVALEGGLARGAALEHAPKLAAAGDAEVEGGSDSLGGERQAIAGRVADEEHAAIGGRPKLVRDPVALVAHGVAVQSARE